MSYSIKDLNNLVNSDEFKTFQIEDNRRIKLGEKIYGRRKDLALTQSELAESAGIPQNKISQLESWTYGEPGRDILERLSASLLIDINYFLLDEIDRKTYEMYNYIIPKLTLWNLSKFQLIKIPYFIDMIAWKELKHTITNYSYIRLNYGPFDKSLYSYMWILESFEASHDEACKISNLSKEEINIIDRVLMKYPVNDGDALKILSYNTYPMKKLWATIWGKEGWRESLIF